MKYTVTAPVKGFTGDVAGVHLADGRYEGELPPQSLAYFREAGYTVERVDEPDPAPQPDPEADPEPPADPAPEPQEPPEGSGEGQSKGRSRRNG